jgi:hypothetical protein
MAECSTLISISNILLRTSCGHLRYLSKSLDSNSLATFIQHTNKISRVMKKIR